MRTMRKPALYPALAAWRRRDGNKPESQWTYDDLWRAAMAEWEAIQNRDDPPREREYQIEAILCLLHGKCTGEPQRHPKVVLDVETQQRYLQRIAEIVVAL